MDNSECEIDGSRRNALKKITMSVGVLAGCSLLPEQWTRPIIGQIVLPAHAGTSGSGLHDPCSLELRGGDTSSADVIIRVTGFVTPPAGNVAIHLVATATGGSGASVTGDTVTDAGGNYSAILTVGGGPGITAVTVTSTATGATGSATCSININAASPPAPVLTQCTAHVQSGDQSTQAINCGVTGAVNPLTTDVPIHIVFTAFLVAGGSQEMAFDTVTGDGTGLSVLGVYSFGHNGFNSGPYTSISVTVTSSVATGTSTCGDAVPLP